MRAARSLKKGLSTFATLSPRDRQWVISSLRASGVPTGSTEGLASFLADTRRRTRRPVVFLSHSHADKRFVRSLSNHLEQQGIEVWVDEAELRVADRLLDRLMASIDKVDYLLVVLSPASVQSRWVRRELKAALSAKVHGRRVEVFPVLKEECTIPAFLRDRLCADFSTPYRRSKNLPHLVESIMSHHRERRTHRRGS